MLNTGGGRGMGGGRGGAGGGHQKGGVLTDLRIGGGVQRILQKVYLPEHCFQLT